MSSHFSHWLGTIGGTANHFLAQWATKLCFIYHRVIKEGTFAALFKNMGAPVGQSPSASLHECGKYTWKIKYEGGVGRVDKRRERWWVVSMLVNRYICQCSSQNYSPLQFFFLSHKPQGRPEPQETPSWKNTSTECEPWNTEAQLSTWKRRYGASWWYGFSGVRWGWDDLVRKEWRIHIVWGRGQRQTKRNDG